jgi:hypothetical protein
MRWVIASVGWLTLVPMVTAQDSEPQKLFEGMLQKLTTAKAYKVQFKLWMEETTKDLKIKGSLVAAEGNRARFTFAGTEDKRSLKTTLTSDGKTMVVQGEADGKMSTTSKAAPDKLYEYFTSYMASAGVLAGNEAGTSAAEPPQLRLSDFKLLGKMKLDGRDVVVIEYGITSDRNLFATVTLSIDAQTQLPLKRVLVNLRGGKVEYKLVETYSDWVLNPTLDGKEFLLPK